MSRRERRAAKARGELPEIAFMVFEHALSDPPPPLCPGSLRDDMCRELEATWCAGGPTLVFRLIAGDRVYTVIPERVDRDFLKAAMPRLIEELGATRYVCVAKSWASDRKECRPSDDPDRKEMLLVGAVAITGENGAGFYQIKRDTDGRASLANWEPAKLSKAGCSSFSAKYRHERCTSYDRQSETVCPFVRSGTPHGGRRPHGGQIHRQGRHRAGLRTPRHHRHAISGRIWGAPCRSSRRDGNVPEVLGRGIQRAPQGGEGRRRRYRVPLRPGSLARPRRWRRSLDEISFAVTKHVALQDRDAYAIALWSAFTHAHDCFDISPILATTSPTPECGKTTLLRLLAALTPRALSASNISSAAMFRTMDKWKPTLLVDEADTFARDNDELRGILNCGHDRSGSFVIRNVGDSFEPKQFCTWGPKAIAMIGKLPPTWQSRSIHIALKRMFPGDHVEPLRQGRTKNLDILSRKARRWTLDHADTLRAADPELPPSLYGRAADNWRPLVAVADLAGGEWPTARGVSPRRWADATTTSRTLWCCMT